LPTEESARLALRTQQIIAHESGITKVADPLGGSVYIEELTNKIERGVRDYLERIDGLGGTLAAIEKGTTFPPVENCTKGSSIPTAGFGTNVKVSFPVRS